LLYSVVSVGTRLAASEIALDIPVAPTMMTMRDYAPYIAGKAGPRGALLTIDTPMVDSEGSLVFEVGFADSGPSPASETLKPLVSAILTEAFIGTLGPLATGVCFTTISASG